MISYTFTPLAYPTNPQIIAIVGPNSPMSLTGISNAGQITGIFQLDGGQEQLGFVAAPAIDGGTFATLIYTSVNDVNDAGQVVASSWDANRLRGFVSSGPFYATNQPRFDDIYYGFNGRTLTISRLDVPGAHDTYVEGVNDAGQMVGYYDDQNGIHGFSDNGGTFTTFDVPGAQSTYALKSNDAGQIVGYYQDSSGAYHGFLDSGGNFTTVEVPGGYDTHAEGINDAGEIVGYYTAGSGARHGFIDDGGTFTTFDFPGATDSYLTDINDSGQIVGYYDQNGGNARGFVASTMRVVYFKAVETNTGDIYYGYTYDNAGRYYTGENWTSTAADQALGHWSYTVTGRTAADSAHQDASYNGQTFDTSYYDNDQKQWYSTYYGSNGIISGSNGIGSDSDLVIENGAAKPFGRDFYVVPEPYTGSYAFTPIDYPGSLQGEALGINDAGQIVGYYSDGTDRFGDIIGQHGFVDSGSSFTSINYSTAGGGGLTVTRGINDAGQIGGYYDDQYGIHGFSDNGGTFTPIGAGAATGINDNGQIVGYSQYTDSVFEAEHANGFVYTDGAVSTFTYPGPTRGYAGLGGRSETVPTLTWAQGINDAGQIVGYYDGDHGFLDSGGTFTTIDVPGARYTYAEGINDAGQIVGYYKDSSGHAHGFLDSGGSFTTIDVPGESDTFLTGINDAGQIVGYYYENYTPKSDSPPIPHGFVASTMQVDYFKAVDSATGDTYDGYTYDDTDRYYTGQSWTSATTNEAGGHWTYTVYSKAEVDTAHQDPSYNGQVFDTSYYDNDKGQSYSTVYGSSGVPSGHNGIGSDTDFVFQNGFYQPIGSDYVLPEVLTAVAFDLNGDTNSDLVFQNNGTPGIWLMNGTTPVAETALPNPGASWHIITSRDVNGDGKADLVWQNTDGTPGIWFMNGTTPIAMVGLANPGSTWHLVAAGDVNGDHNTDLLWQNSDGTPGVWEMNGTTPIAQAGLGNPGANWKVVGAADFNGDGRDDILLQNTGTGNLMIDLMNGTSVASTVSITIGDPSWHAVSTGVFNGQAEIAWQNNNGTVGIWLMNGTTPVAEASLSNPDANWQLISVDHFTPNGQADLLFQNTNGAMMLWEMNGTRIAAEVNLPNPGPAWQSVNGHPFAAGGGA